MSTIEWTDATWNPVTGCTKISAGCKNCYAEAIAKRFWGPRKFSDVRVHDDRLQKPLHWRKPRMVFVNSMSDLFHESVPFEFIDRVFHTMERCRQHVFQILTKRADRLLEYSERQDRKPPLPNVWLGVSAENQETYDQRVPLLLECPAAVHWMSLEPLLGPTDLCLDLYPVSHPRPEWVVTGGESGPGARRCDTNWIRSIVYQCKEGAVPVFVKQLGSHIRWGGYGGDGNAYLSRCAGGISDAKGGNPAEWPQDLNVREFPSTQERDAVV